MKFFTQYFKLHDQATMDNGEYAVKCPFPHTDGQGNPYLEERASAHINPDKSLFHCKSCDVGYSEAMFIVQKEGISYKNALAFLGIMDSSKQWDNYRENFVNSDLAKGLTEKLGLTSVSDELQLGYKGTGISFPVFIYGELLDIRTYNPDGDPKVKGEYGSKPLILPFDLWIDDDRPTILNAGEKDMAIARAYGFNSITFTGGEMSFPKLFKASFKGRKIYITYDNDEAGREGASKMAFMLRDAGAIVYLVEGHYEVCTEKGEDIHDFFVKYGKSAEDLQAILDATEEFTFEEYLKAKERTVPRVTIEESTQGKYVGVRYVQSPVTVVSIFDDAFNVPDFIHAEKYRSEDKCLFNTGDTWEWSLDEENLEDLLHLMDNNITEAKRDAAIRNLMGIPAKEKFIRVSIRSTTSIFKSFMSDNMETVDDDVKSMEMLAFSIGERLVAGKKYIIQYKPVPHPIGQKIVAIIKDAQDNDIELQNFKVNKDLLNPFQVKEGETVSDKMEELFDRAKGFVGVEARKTVTWATDLFFHTPLEFKLGQRVERAYLDAMIIGDPRTMKSATAKAMTKMYELGKVTSLKTATKAGLIGGSDNSSGGWKTKVGLLPRSHKGAVIMEEFSGGNQFISSLTEIRSSNRVRLERVNGSLDVPAMVRMLSISNPATHNKTSLSLRQYASGIPVILDLIGASEDIARYDFFLLVDEQVQFISPLDMFDLEPYQPDEYRHRVRWVWSRTADQVVLDRPIAQYIVDESQKLNAIYDCHIKLFGPEAWKKISRVAIAVAGLVVSTDETYENLIVKKEHVDFAVQFLVDCYDNDIFRLKEYVEEEKRYNECRAEDIVTLQGLYNNHSVLLMQLEMSTETSFRQMQSMSGLDQKDFSGVMNELARSHFFKRNGESIIPSQKFREAMRKVVAAPTYLKRASER